MVGDLGYRVDSAIKGNTTSLVLHLGLCSNAVTSAQRGNLVEYVWSL
jgi:hypothetical protein